MNNSEKQPNQYQALLTKANRYSYSKIFEKRLTSLSDGEADKFLSQKPKTALKLSKNHKINLTIQELTHFFVTIIKPLKNEIEFMKSKQKELSNHDQINEIKDKRILKYVGLLKLEYFCLNNKSENIKYGKIESVIECVQNFVLSIEKIISFSASFINKTIEFTCEEEFVESLKSIYPKNFLQSNIRSKLFCELWRFIRKVGIKSDPKFQKINETAESIILHSFGISLPTPYLEDYPIHRAVYESNLPLIRKLCAKDDCPYLYCHINQSDPAGLTPLMLAVLLGKKDAVTILANHGADPKLRCSLNGKTPLEEAINKKHREMIKSLLNAANSIKQNIWENNKALLIKTISHIPDFSFEMSWECDSKILPFLRKIAPSDSYKIFKLKDALRIDLCLLGSKKSNSKGHKSILFNCKSYESGKLCLVDHANKITKDLFSDIDSNEIEKKVDELISNEQVNNEIKSEDIAFIPARNWNGEIVTQKIEGYKCTKFNATGTMSVLSKKSKLESSLNLKKFESYAAFFDYIIQEPLIDICDEYYREKSAFRKIDDFLDKYKYIDNKSTSDPKCKTNDDPNAVIKNQVKKIDSQIFMAENFPLTLEHLFPILDILSNVSPQINRLKEFLDKKDLLPKADFPLKAYIPIFFTTNAVISLKNFQFESPAPLLFEFSRIFSEKKSIKACESEESDDEEVKKCWEQILNKTKSKANQEIKYPWKVKYEEEVVDKELEDNLKNFQDFFINKSINKSDHDLINVYESDASFVASENFNELSERKGSSSMLDYHHTADTKSIVHIQERSKLSTLMNSQPNELNSCALLQNEKPYLRIYQNLDDRVFKKQSNALTFFPNSSRVDLKLHDKNEDSDLSGRTPDQNTYLFAPFITSPNRKFLLKLNQDKVQPEISCDETMLKPADEYEIIMKTSNDKSKTKFFDGEPAKTNQKIKESRLIKYPNRNPDSFLANRPVNGIQIPDNDVGKIKHQRIKSLEFVKTRNSKNSIYFNPKQF